MFQLENLALTPMQFALLDLRRERTSIHPDLDLMMSRSQAVSAADALKRLRELDVPPSIPVVLLSEDGTAARDLFPVLEREGFQQVYVVADGERGLRRELAEEG